jgi:hypothetical protein
MKTLKKVLILVTAATGFAHGATVISIKNYATLNTVGVPILDTTGNAITSAGGRGISIGYFTTGFDFATATAATIKSNFTIFGSTTSFTQNGMFNTSISVPLPANDTSFTGKTIYTVIGNAATTAAASAFAVMTANVLFPTVDAGSNGAATSLTTAASHVVFGQLMAPVTQPSGTATYPQGVQILTEAVPEPSAALLGALGALGLLRRRRI